MFQKEVTKIRRPIRALEAPVRAAEPAGCQFGDLVIDCGRRLVQRGHDTLAINGLSFDLLVALLDSAPNLVTPDELMKRVWPEVIVNPETISQRVKLLRHALGDDARAPRYIAVVRGRGYRAIAAVTPGQRAPAARRFPGSSVWPSLSPLPAIALAVLAFVVGLFLLQQSSVAFLRKQSPAALDLYGRARHLHQSFRLDRMDKAIRYYQRAIELDPKFARAYVGLADALMLRRQVAELGPHDPARVRVESLARTALEIEPRLGDAHAILGRELASSFDLKGAARELALAENVSPTGEYVLRYLAQFHGCCALPVAKAIEYARKGTELDHLDAWTETNLAIAYWHARRFDEALRQIDLVLELDPQFWVAHELRTVVLDDLGRFTEALIAARVTVELRNCRQTRADLAIAYARVGDTPRARRIYDELAGGAPGKYWSPTEAAMVLVALNDRAGALSALERAYRERDEKLVEVIQAKRLAPLMEEPRFRRIAKLLGHPPADAQ
jgi:DNA-binding winged helix-turn-helix (wHTH) protein/tetratricopeptide (TPR) repeat protein